MEFSCVTTRIDGLCYWFGSLLLNLVTCNCGNYYLDMIFVENIQVMIPGHVIDVVSSMQLFVNLDWFF